MRTVYFNIQHGLLGWGQIILILLLHLNMYTETDRQIETETERGEKKGERVRDTGRERAIPGG